MDMNLSDAIKVRVVKAASTAGTDAVESDVVDMANYEGVVFLASITTANAGNFLKAQKTDSDGSNPADLASTKLVPASNGMGVVMDVFRPRDRYIRLHATRGVSTALGVVYAVQYRGRKPSETNVVSGANGMAAAKHISPAEGTA